MVDLVPWWLEQTDDINPHQLLIEAAGEAALWPKGTAGQSADRWTGHQNPRMTACP